MINNEIIAARAARQGSEHCICKGNWRDIIAENQHLIERHFVDKQGDIYSFVGIIHGKDDYYYGMFCPATRYDPEEFVMLSCVGSIENHGFTLIEE